MTRTVWKAPDGGDDSGGDQESKDGEQHDHWRGLLTAEDRGARWAGSKSRYQVTIILIQFKISTHLKKIMLHYLVEFEVRMKDSTILLIFDKTKYLLERPEVILIAEFSAMINDGDLEIRY